MSPPDTRRSRLSRETRLLLTTIALSIVALLVLARVRFPDRAATPHLVPPLLTQLASPSPLEDFSKALVTLEAEVMPLLRMLSIREPSSGMPEVLPALRFRDDLAIAVVAAAHADRIEGGVLARDPATGLAVIRMSAPAAPVHRIWTPQRTGYPRSLLVTEASPAGPWLRPIFVGPLNAAGSAAWGTPVWPIPDHVSARDGAFVFTTTGALCGVVIREGDAQAIVPAEAAFAAAERLLQAEQKPRGSLGVAVQEITPEIRDATGLTSGVVVVRVEAPAEGDLVPTDIIEQINEQPIVGVSDWNARMARLTAGEEVSLRVRGHDGRATVRLAAAPLAATPVARLGLTMRAIRGTGAEVTAVETGSVAERAGLNPGDIVTRIEDVKSPSPAQVNRAFAALGEGRALLAAITRGPDHLVVAIRKP